MPVAANAVDPEALTFERPLYPAAGAAQLAATSVLPSGPTAISWQLSPARSAVTPTTLTSTEAPQPFFHSVTVACTPVCGLVAVNVCDGPGTTDAEAVVAECRSWLTANPTETPIAASTITAAATDVRVRRRLSCRRSAAAALSMRSRSCGPGSTGSDSTSARLTRPSRPGNAANDASSSRQSAQPARCASTRLRSAGSSAPST